MPEPEPGSAAHAVANLSPEALRTMADKVEDFDPKRAEFLRTKASEKEAAE